MYYPTSEKLASENYPYGFRLKTTKYDWLEFRKGKGFRHASQTINPKNTRLNAEKYGTYYDILLLTHNEEGHVKCHAWSLNGRDEINRACVAMSANFDCFSVDEVRDIYERIWFGLAVDMKATCVYGGAKIADIKSLYVESMELANIGKETGVNLFAKIKIDTSAVDSFKPENFNPFGTI